MRFHLLPVVALAAAPFLIHPVEAQTLPRPEPEAPITESEERSLESDAVEESLPPDPARQGTRPPMEAQGEDQGAEEDTLYNLLAVIRRAPRSLQGEPVPRPNTLASMPAKEMPPELPQNLYLFPEGYVE